MEPTEHNRRAWDDLHRSRVAAPPSATGLPLHVRRALADLNGKRVLALRCGTGESAAELADLGATVTGVDDSAEVLAIARERRPTILWIQGDLVTLPRELKRGRFDLVYGGEGILALVQDLDGWLAEVASTLRPGGDLLLFDDHPVAACVDGLLHWRESYFDEGRLRLGQLVGAAVRAGLTVRALEEYPQPPGNPRHHDARVPGAFLLHAQRP